MAEQPGPLPCDLSGVDKDCWCVEDKDMWEGLTSHTHGTQWAPGDSQGHLTPLLLEVFVSFLHTYKK